MFRLVSISARDDAYSAFFDRLLNNSIKWNSEGKINELALAEKRTERFPSAVEGNSNRKNCIVIVISTSLVDRAMNSFTGDQIVSR